ncbi:hypothetical protein [Bacillus cereus]|uniref:hypothetical protein n=1 Tax=Bacillus cereus TaxID=1396 RepID=UPI0001A11E6B|nr:hypothetical protein bcere0027_51380 [Bacillus cereus AH676]
MEGKNMHDLKEEFRGTVLSSFLIFVGAIISIFYGNLAKDLFDTNVSVWIYVIACYVVPFIFMLLEFWLVARTRRIVKEINNF